MTSVELKPLFAVQFAKQAEPIFIVKRLNAQTGTS